MSILGDLTNKVKSDLTWKASSEVSSGISTGISKIFNRNKTPGTNKCPKCKIQITDSSLKFCPKCGFKLMLSCSKCKVDFPAGTEFCTQCGAKLK